MNINTISVAFNENVSINTADSALALVGSSDLPAPAALSSATFNYNSTTHTATWTFAAPLTTDRYMLCIPSADVTDALGAAMSGGWTNGSSAYPSGNATSGGNLNFEFNILKADVTQDGGVTGLDGNAVRVVLLTNTTTSGYSPFADFTGAGSVTGIDGSYVRVNLETVLPTDSPSPPSGGDAIVATIARSNQFRCGRRE